MEAGAIVTALPCTGMWNSYVRLMMDPATGSSCAGVRIWISSASCASTMDRSKPLGDGRLPITIVPARLVRITQRHILERTRACGIAPRHDEPVFPESRGEPMTRASLFDSIRRAMTLVRL